MALTVEDGTGLTTAEAYVSVADADAYHTAYGNTGWTGTEAAKEVALRRATQYIDSRYRFRGVRKDADQALEWPRVGYEPDGRTESWPPTLLEQACCEAALRALSDTLRADASADQVVEETVGPITVRYAGKSGQTRYPVVDDLLSRYAMSTGLFARLERAS